MVQKSANGIGGKMEAAGGLNYERGKRGVRWWCKQVFPESFGWKLDWIEWAEGGTAGFPDLILSYEDERMPIELKWWQRTTLGTKCEMRPLQRQYHLLEARAGRKTLIMFGNNENEYTHIYILPGKYVPMKDYPNIDTVCAKLWSGRKVRGGLEHSGFDHAMKLFLDVVGDDNFWI